MFRVHAICGRETWRVSLCGATDREKTFLAELPEVRDLTSHSFSSVPLSPCLLRVGCHQWYTTLCAPQDVDNLLLPAVEDP